MFLLILNSCSLFFQLVKHTVIIDLKCFKVGWYFQLQNERWYWNFLIPQRGSESKNMARADIPQRKMFLKLIVAVRYSVRVKA